MIVGVNPRSETKLQDALGWVEVLKLLKFQKIYCIDKKQYNFIKDSNLVLPRERMVVGFNSRFKAKFQVASRCVEV